MIIDGRVFAAEVLASTKVRAQKLSRLPRVIAIAVNETPTTKSYLAIKQKKAIEAGCVFEVIHIKNSSQPLEVFNLATSIIRVSDADAILVQLPLPEGVDTKALCDVIPVGKDADVLSSNARARFSCGDEYALVPPVVGAVQKILEYGDVEVRGKKAVVIGEGWLVGNPCAIWLRQQGAEVTVVTLESGDLSAALRVADIIISGAGSPHLIKPDLIKEGVVLIDAGASESNGAIVGDADPLCAEKCSVFTPVPGGVGPIAVAKLFENATFLSEKTMKD